MCNEEKIIAAWNAEMYEKYETETDDVDFLLSVIGSKYWRQPVEAGVSLYRWRRQDML